MFESTGSALQLDDLRVLRSRLVEHAGDELDEAALIDQIAELELLKSTAAAAQAVLTVRLVEQRTANEEERGVPAAQRGRGLSAEIALARRESPVRGARSLGLAKALVGEMPCTLAALRSGAISEWQATLVARETAVLSREDRMQVDTELSSELGTLSDRQVAAAARSIGYRLDPGSALRRTRGANADRYVSLRPAPDTMTYLTGFLPVALGVACQVALQREADSLRAQGDERTRGQIMADTLVARVTGRDVAQGPAVEVQLVMTDAALLDGAQETAEVRGYGPIPAPLARELVRSADQAWIRRLFVRPEDGALVAMESRRRTFDGQLREFIVARDQFCRRPWCGALIRQADHILRAANGGETSADNGQGLCECCNYSKESPGWSTARSPGARHPVTTTTPTRHEYVSVAPRLSG